MKINRTIAVLIALILIACGAAQAEQWMDAYAQAIVQETNHDRAAYGLPGLRTDPALMQAARVRAMEISRKFSHTRPDGSSWRTVSGVAAGENIARGHKTPDKTMAAWMSSSGHRANILRKSYGSIGVACVKVNGIYHWVQLFGR